jgi:hypothetical protein
MKRFTLLGVVLIAIFAASAALSAVAFADETPLDLPFVANETMTGKSEGEPEFKSSNGTVICKEATEEGNIESNLPPLGLFHIHFKGCKDKATGVTCTGLGEESGVILVLGKWHLVWDEKLKAKYELHTATLFLVEPVHFTCFIVLIEVKGETLCLDLKEEESEKTHSFHCVGEESEKKFLQNDEWCKKDVKAECVELITPKLETSINHEAFGGSFELALGNASRAKEKVAAMKL